MRFRKTTTTDVLSDLDQLLGDVRALLSSKVKEVDPALSQLGHRLEQSVDRIRTSSSKAAEQSRALAQDADDYVHTSPWPVVGGALAVGVVLGLMFSKR
ncbi:ElaB/YgaM/YqjD family protein [Comamonas humi]